MIINIIMFICMYPVLFILYFCLKGEVESESFKGTLFGIRISREWLPGEEKERFEQDYNKSIKRSMLVLALTPLLAFFIPYTSLYLTFWCLWIFAAIALFQLPYARNYKRLLALKSERTCTDPDNAFQYYELKYAGNIRCIKWYHLSIPLLISGLATLVSLFLLFGQRLQPYGLLMILFFFCNLALGFCAAGMDRMKTQVVSSDSDVNVNYARAVKNLWKKFWCTNIWAMTLYMVSLLICFMMPRHTDSLAFYTILWGSILLSMALLVLGIILMNHKAAIDKTYKDQMDLKMDNDEKFWIGGIIYYNPGDPHAMVERKFGTGTSMNMATFPGRVCAVICLLAFLSVPILCCWMILEEFTPLSLTVQDHMLTAEHVSTDYSIPIESIQEVTLLTELPKSTKVNGTGMSTLQKGVFRNSTDGRVYKFLNPKNHLFLRIDTGETIYYMSSSSDRETQAIYDLLYNAP